MANLKLLVLLLCCFFMNNNLLTAQKSLNKGAIMIGGGTILNNIVDNFQYSDRSDKFKEIHFTFEAGIGYFISDKIATGIKLNHSSEFERYSDFTNRHNTSINAFIRYYPVLLFFGEVDLGYGFYNINTSSQGIDHHQGLRSAVSLGYSILLNSSIAIEPTINYKLSVLNADKDLTNSAGLDKVLKNELFFMLTLQVFLKNETN